MNDSKEKKSSNVMTVIISIVALIIVILIALAIIGVSGYFIYTKNVKPELERRSPPVLAKGTMDMEAEEIFLDYGEPKVASAGFRGFKSGADVEYRSYMNKLEANQACEKLGGRLATLDELKQAGLRGADWCGVGFVSDSDNVHNVVARNRNGCIQTPVAGIPIPEKGAGAVCMARKPEGDRYSHFNELEGIPSMFSQKQNNEAYYIYGEFKNLQEAAQACKNYNGDVATSGQVEVANQNGAEWCDYGYVKNDILVQPSQGNCGPTKPKGLNKIDNRRDIERTEYKGVNCFGIKPLDPSHLQKKDSTVYSWNDKIYSYFNKQPIEPIQGKCEAGQYEYRQYDGGFCCDSKPLIWNGTEYTVCNSNICALDENNSEGHRICGKPAQQGTCPSGQFQFNKDFCCTVHPSEYKDGMYTKCGNQGIACALNANNNPDNLPLCQTPARAMAQSMNLPPAII